VPKFLPLPFGEGSTSFEPTLENYSIVLGGGEGATGTPFSVNLMSSLLIGGLSTLLAVFLATLAAYGFSRFPMKGKKDWLFFILSTRFMPPLAVVVPVLLMYRQLDLQDVIEVSHLRQLVDAFAHGLHAPRGQQLVVRVAIGRRPGRERLGADVRHSLAGTRLDVERLVEGDAVDPRPKPGLAPVGRHRMVHAQHHVLGNVLGLRHTRLAKDGRCQPNHRPAIAPYQLGKRGLVA